MLETHGFVHLICMIPRCPDLQFIQRLQKKRQFKHLFMQPRGNELLKCPLITSTDIVVVVLLP